METETSRPALRPRSRIPFGELTPEEFETFVYSALGLLAPSLGFRVENKSGSTGDGGFDAWGRRAIDGAVVCVQCKRMESALGIDDVGHELAKVALTAALDDATVLEHYFACSGTIARTVTKALKQDGRTSLIAEARKACSHEKLANLRAQALSRFSDPEAIVDRYVSTLQRLVAWSGDAFDAELGRVWSELSGLLRRHFDVHVVVMEEPRPDFDEAAHLARLGQRVPIVSLMTRQTRVPDNIRAPANTQSVQTSLVDAVDALLSVPKGACTFLLGGGGAGKTTTLQAAACKAADRRVAELASPLPVIVALRDYRGDLESLIATELDVRRGRWRSLPDEFLLLLDGLNEVSYSQAARVARDIELLLRDPRYAIVVSIRANGPERPLSFHSVGPCWLLEDLSVRQVQQLAASVVGERRVAGFMIEFRRSLGAGRSLATRPFAVAAMLEHYAERGALPLELHQVLDGLISRRYRRNEEIAVTREARSIPESLLRKVASEVAFEMFVVRRAHSLDRHSLQDLVRAVRTRLIQQSTYGVEDFGDTETLSALEHYELLKECNRTEIDPVAAIGPERSCAPAWDIEVSGLNTKHAAS